MFAGTLCTISSKIHLKYVMFCAIWYYLHNLKNVENTHGGVLPLVKLQTKSLWSVNVTFNVTIVSVVIALEFTIASISTSSVCNDSSSKLFTCFKQGVEDTSGSSDLPLSGSSHVTFCRGIVDPGNPICSVPLQVLVYSTVVHVLQGFPQFFNCPNKVTVLPLSDLICRMLPFLPKNS